MTHYFDAFVTLYLTVHNKVNVHPATFWLVNYRFVTTFSRQRMNVLAMVTLCVTFSVTVFLD